MPNAKRRLPYFTGSAGFVHSVVKRDGAPLSHSEDVLTEMGRRAGFDVDCTKDGGVFDTSLDGYDGVAFYTTGDLTQTTVRERRQSDVARRNATRNCFERCGKICRQTTSGCVTGKWVVGKRKQRQIM